ncbi:MAG TPA: protein kinase [Thermoanaerobaculia bacterium]|nr:protein kinase [Thermoanaerobaculia bacterium]
MTLQNGTRLGPYEILAPLGAGGMGEVYRARDTRLGRSVAIKILSSEFARDVRLRRRLEREAKAISALNHPHICTLHDVGTDNGVDYLVLEHCEGKTLARRVADGALPIEQLLDYGSQIADALEKAHRHGIIHRDLKPSNIMITKSGAKVLDFGLAKERVAAAPDHSTMHQDSDEGTLVGTIQYMAPETLQGKDADARSDIFALGLILYEMLTGSPAFTASSKAGLIAAILEREPAPVSASPRDVPAVLARLIKACLAKNPDDRIQSAHDVLLQLQWMKEAERSPRLRPENRVWPVIVGVLIATAVAVAAVSAFLMLRPPRNEPAIRRLSITLPGEAPVGFTQSGGNLFAISRDGKRLAYIGPQQALYVRDLDALTVRRLAGTEKASNPFFSYDGTSLGFEADRKLKKISLTGGNPVTICEGVTVRGAVWGKDDMITFGQAMGVPMRVPAGGGAAVPLSASKFLRLPSLLSGEDEVLFTLYNEGGNPDDHDLVLLTPRDGKLRTILPSASHGQYVSTGRLIFLRARSIYSVAFDRRKMEITGTPKPILDDVAAFPPQGLAYIATTNGNLYYLPHDESADQRQLVWSDRAGRVTLVTDKLQGYGHAGGPELSPDGKQILTSICLRGECDIWRYEIERESWNRVTSDGRSCSPCWSPDGRSIAYSSNRTGPYNVFIVPTDASVGPRQITHGSTWVFPQAWSPDGKVLATFEGTAATAGDISFVALDGNRRTPYVTTDAAEESPNFSPDGRWLAYTSTQSGKTEVYVRATDGQGATWKISDDGGTSPRWRGDGKELFYMRQRVMMAAAIRTVPEFHAAKPYALFEGNFDEYFDVTRDGQRFILTTRYREPALRTQINVVEGLFARQ